MLENKRIRARLEHIRKYKTSVAVKQTHIWRLLSTFLNRKQTRIKYMQTYFVTKSRQVMLVRCHHRRLNKINCLLLFNEIYDKRGLLGDLEDNVNDKVDEIPQTSAHYFLHELSIKTFKIIFTI